MSINLIIILNLTQILEYMDSLFNELGYGPFFLNQVDLVHVHRTQVHQQMHIVFQQQHTFILHLNHLLQMFTLLF